MVILGPERFFPSQGRPPPLVPTHQPPQLRNTITARIAPIERITIRDAKSYCAILMDDNNRRPICRP
ncbi:hypothetical protein B5V46_15530 [Rhodovulum sp. MB263]|nr:hypothetical protein B5V46_15530 [Rhodovulum sp. MB263]